MQEKVYNILGKKLRSALSIGKGRLYCDAASTTPVSFEVENAMMPFWSEMFGNPSSITREGVSARAVVEESRVQVATILGASPRTVVFTSGGTESNNLAIMGVLGRAPRGHVVVSKIEHPSVKEPIRAWELAGGEVTWLDAEEDGTVDPAKIRTALRPDTLLVALMWANNETGVWQKVRETARVVKASRVKGTRYPHFHIDACQGPGYLSPKVLVDIGADTITFSAQKLYGPKGIGALYVRPGAFSAPLQRGGGHEFGLRAGTENVPLIVGFATAFALAESEREVVVHTLSSARDSFEKQLKKIEGVVVNGTADRLPGFTNVSFLGVSGELTVLELDTAGVAVSTGSACGTKDADPSAVLRAMGLGNERAGSAVRFSFLKDIRTSDIKKIVAVLPDILLRQRRF